jgi:uncharacterized glyoxalase superfamily protein PhnB
VAERKTITPAATLPKAPEKGCRRAAKVRTATHRRSGPGDSVIMLSEANAQMPATPVMLHLYLEDVDAAFERALRAGGVVVQRPSVQFYGDRSGGVKEPGGNTIWIATHVEDVPPEELKKRAAAAMQGKG